MKEINRELLFEFELGQLSPGKIAILKLVERFWDDGSSCFQLIKYVRSNGYDKAYWPAQYVQIPREFGNQVKELINQHMGDRDGKEEGNQDRG